MRPSRTVRLLTGKALDANNQKSKASAKRSSHLASTGRLSAGDWECVCLCGWHSIGTSYIEARTAGRAHCAAKMPPSSPTKSSPSKAAASQSKPVEPISKSERRQRKSRELQEASLQQRVAQTAREMGLGRGVLMNRRIQALDAGWPVEAILSGRAFNPDGSIAAVVPNPAG